MPESFFNNLIFTNIALTLLHFLWQGVLVAGALKVAFSLISQKRSQLRYLLATSSMALLILLPCATYLIIEQSFLFQDLSNKGNNSTLINFPILSADTNFTDNLLFLMPYLTFGWLAGVLILVSKFIIEMYQVNQLPKSGISQTYETLQQHFDTLITKINLSNKPKLIVSLSVHVPMTIGWLKPVVLVPASMVTGLTPAQMDMLLLHELAHIKRHDYLVNLLQSCAEILLFFHPGVHWVSKQMRIEREYCSDDIAVQHCGDPLAYAHTLTDTASLCHKHRHQAIPTMAMAASGGDLKQRVLRLVNHHHCTSNVDKSKWLAAILIISTLFLVLVQQAILVFSSPKSEQPTAESAYKEIAVAKPAIPLPKTIKKQRSNNLPAVQPTPAEKIEVQPPTNQTFENTVLETQNEATHATEQKQNTIAQTAPSKALIAEQTSSIAEQSVSPTDTRSQEITEKSVTQAIVQQYTRQPQLDKSEELDEQVATTVQQTNVITKIQSNISNEQEASSTTQVVKTNNINSVTTEKNSITQSQLNIENSDNDFVSAKALTTVGPKYPNAAKRNTLEMDILVNFSIDTKGKVKDIEIERKNNSRYFKSEIKKALAQWQFKPAEKDGLPVESSMSKRFSFNLHSTS